MGVARNASSGDKRSWFDLRRNTPPGAPVPGTGGRHGRRKNKSGSNKSGALTMLNQEWSASGRKQEDEQRGINNRARQQTITEQLADMAELSNADDIPFASADEASDYIASLLR